MNEYDRDDRPDVRFHTSGDDPALHARRAGPAPDEVSEFARDGDPSLVTQPLSLSASERVRSEIVWMRPTEILQVMTARVAGQGIDLLSAIARRARPFPPRGDVDVRDQARQLPPVTAFGSGRHAHGAVQRSGIGR